MSSSFSLVSAASANLTNVMPKPCALKGWFIINTSALTRYVRIYDTRLAPNPAVDVPILRFPLPTGDGTNLSVDLPLSRGLAFDITGAPADSDTTAIGAGDVTINLLFE